MSQARCKRRGGSRSLRSFEEEAEPSKKEGSGEKGLREAATEGAVGEGECR